MSRRSSIVWLVLLTISGAIAHQARPVPEIRFPTIEARYDAVVLVADVSTGALIGGVRTGEAHTRQYYPASLFKLPIAVAALSSGRVSASDTYTCKGLDTIGGHVYKCWRDDGHGKLDLRRAIAHSCNLYFRNLSQGLSRSSILQAARSLGMIPATGITGNSPTRTGTLTDENLLGEAYQLTPHELLATATLLATHGRNTPAGSLLSQSRYRPLYEGLMACVREGTGSEGKSSRFAIAGKTGTAEMPEQVNKTVGWFIGYAPAAAPRYSVCVMMRQGRGSDAARIAREVLEELL